MILAEMKNVDPQTVDPDKLTDIYCSSILFMHSAKIPVVNRQLLDDP